MSKEEIGTFIGRGFLPKTRILKPINEDGNTFLINRGIYIVTAKYGRTSSETGQKYESIQGETITIYDGISFGLDVFNYNKWIGYDCESKILTVYSNYAGPNGDWYNMYLEKLEVVCIAEY